MGSYTIRDLERITGIKCHTIRIWEQRYQVVNPARTDTNIRHYCDNDLRKLLSISILNRSGHRISKIAGMPDDKLRQEVLSLALNDTDLDSRIDGLVMSMIELCEDKFEKILNSAISQYGFERTLTHIIHPFFQKVGILWLSGTIIPAQEHFISNLIRQKLITAIDQIQSDVNPRLPSYLLFLPEWEMHEMGLLFYHYLLRKEGHKVIYLGQVVPLRDLEEIVTLKRPDVMLSVFTARQEPEFLQSYLDELGSSFRDLRIRVNGNQITEPGIHLSPNTAVLEAPASFRG